LVLALRAVACGVLVLAVLTPPLTKAFGFLNQNDPEQVRREALELFHSNLELIEELALINPFASTIFLGGTWWW
jgi:hypothetical protein